MLIHINQIVDFLIQHINIGEQIVVLLFSFDESVLDLNNIS